MGRIGINVAGPGIDIPYQEAREPRGKKQRSKIREPAAAERRDAGNANDDETPARFLLQSCRLFHMRPSDDR